MAEDRAQRTEKPTPKRQGEARQKGNVPRTKELAAAMSLGAFLLFCHFGGRGWLDQVRALIVESFSQLPAAELTPDQWLSTLRSLGSATAALLLLPVGTMMVAGLAGNLVQGPPPFTLHPFKPDLKRLDPIQGLKKVFTLRSLVSLGKASLNLLLFSAIAVSAVWEAFVDGVPASPGVEGALTALLAVMDKVLVRVVLLWLAIAIADLFFTRYDHARNLRMTKEEVKDERKQQEGDPRVKARIRSKQFELARARMMAEVPKATVVVTNPTHFAVALRYAAGDADVPRVLAKGRGLIAERIREIARQHRIPIVQDPPLARALYKLVPLGGFIPAALFRAVAEVLALVLRPRGARRPDRRPGAAP